MMHGRGGLLGCNYYSVAGVVGSSRGSIPLALVDETSAKVLVGFLFMGNIFGGLPDSISYSLND